MTHQEKITRWIGAGKTGVEIGAGTTPLPGLTPPPIYVDCFTEFGHQPCRADYYGHACALPFHDNSLDYVASSHVLEHVANPVAAFAEWYRVLRPGGIIYLVVPDRRTTWDHPRALTEVEHFLADYVGGITACDATHIDEFVHGVDWTRYDSATTAADLPAKQASLAAGMHAAVARGDEINIHFHTFEPANLLPLLERLRTWPPRRFNWDVVDHAEYFPEDCPNGLLVILRVNKTWHDHAEADWFQIRTQGQRAAVLRDDAKPLGGVPVSTGGKS